MAKSKMHERISKNSFWRELCFSEDPRFFFCGRNGFYASYRSQYFDHTLCIATAKLKNTDHCILLWSFRKIFVTLCVQYSVSAKRTKNCSWTENNLRKNEKKWKWAANTNEKNISTSAIGNLRVNKWMFLLRAMPVRVYMFLYIET